MTASDVLCNPWVEHLVPRPFATNGHAVVQTHLLEHAIMRAAARLTSELVREHRPTMHANMMRHAPNYRLFGDKEVLWTTARVAFMRAGSWVKHHRDEENMPGTLGADLILSFGEVRGATLTLHVDGQEIKIAGAKTVLADFLNPHEVSVLEGSGLRVALIFWQQRTVVLSDHVVNTLKAHVFSAGWKTLVPHPQPTSHERSAGGDLVFVLGFFGAGKTTVVRALADALQAPQAKTGEGGKGAWIHGGKAAVLGRWSGHHADGGSKMAGRLDGCDRLSGAGGDRAACKKALPALHAAGVRLLVADGTALLNQPLLQLAQSVGYSIRLLELDTTAEAAAARAQARDAGTASAEKRDRWSHKRDRWSKVHKERAPLTKVSPQAAIALLHALAGSDAAMTTGCVGQT